MLPSCLPSYQKANGHSFSFISSHPLFTFSSTLLEFFGDGLVGRVTPISIWSSSSMWTLSKLPSISLSFIKNQIFEKTEAQSYNTNTSRLNFNRKRYKNNAYTSCKISWDFVNKHDPSKIEPTTSVFVRTKKEVVGSIPAPVVFIHANFLIYFLNPYSSFNDLTQ